jgi:hypothetical protein
MNPSTPLETLLRIAGEQAMNCSPAEYARRFVRDIAAHGCPKLEDGRLGYRKTTEDGLTNSLVASMQTAYPWAIREPDAAGHIDIALKHPLTFNFVVLGEAKVIDEARGFSWYATGLKKLVAKYNSGRNDLGLMVCYCRLPEMYEVIETYRKKILAEGTAQFVAEADGVSLGLDGVKGTFVTRHSSSGSQIEVAHVWANMSCPTDSEVLATPAAVSGGTS